MKEGVRASSQILLLGTGAITEINRADGPALVYCSDGAGRSPLVVAAKMAREEEAPYDIYDALSNARPGFMLNEMQDKALTYFTEVVAD
jgi:hypothetical protein